MTAPVLSVRDLCVYFHTEQGEVKAVDGVSFDVQPGEVLGIVGESGSGKSVSNLAVMGLLPKPPAYFPRGEVLFDGRSMLKARDRELRAIRGRRVAMIFQDPMTSLNPYLTIERQLTEVLEEHESISREDARKRAVAMLSRVGIPDAERRIDAYPHELSGGMRQRVMIAMALLCGPELLIADEPTTAVDVTIQAQILALIKELQAGKSMSVILITHDLGVVAGMAHRVLVMYAGRIVEAADTETLFERPRHPYTRALLQSVPRLDAAPGTVLASIPGLPPDLSNLDAGCPFRPRCPLAMPRCASAYPPNVGTAEHPVHCYAEEGQQP
ncbi:MAG TPA: ABC transporter ATP-binding protein [Polyangiales bacterium]|nr:ABC transporter ATP-binding protein [Polyangiales bacterium]